MEGRPLDDGELIERARRGDMQAYGELVQRYQEVALRTALVVGTEPHEAEDATQEAFVRAFRNIRSYRGEGRFYTWLYHIVVRVCLDRRRLARWRMETKRRPPLKVCRQCKLGFRSSRR